MPDRQRATRGARREVCTKPRRLGGVGAAGDDRAVAVEHDDVPGPQVEAVVPLRGIACGRPQVAEIPACIRGLVLMVAYGRLGSTLVASPGRVVSIGVIRRAAVF